MPISWRIGPLTTAMLVIEVVLLDLAVDPLPASARITGRYSGRAPAITAFTATFSTVYSQNSRKEVGRIRPTISSGGVARTFQHRRDSLLGRQHDRQIVGPMVINE